MDHPLHGVGLPRGCLSIGENGSIVTAQHIWKGIEDRRFWLHFTIHPTLDNTLGGRLVHLELGHLRSQHFVKVVFFALNKINKYLLLGFAKTFLVILRCKKSTQTRYRGFVGDLMHILVSGEVHGDLWLHVLLLGVERPDPAHHLDGVLLDRLRSLQHHGGIFSFTPPLSNNKIAA